MRSAIPILLTLTSVLLLDGCGRDGPGLVMGEDGTFKANSPANERARIVAIIDRQLDGQLAGHWHTTATIAEMPTWNPDFDDSNREWTWDKATISVSLRGDGAPLPVSEEELRAAVVRFMRPRTLRPDSNLRVTVTTATAPVPVAGQPLPPGAPAGAAQAYVIQAGDSLARISAAFYGTNSRWNAILSANPGLDPANLPIGQSIVIPPFPDGAGRIPGAGAPATTAPK